MVLLEDAAVFLVGGRADAAQFAVAEHRLDEVGGVHHAARGGTGADHGVDLVDEEHGARLLAQLREHRLQALLEVAAVLGARDQRAHVERPDGRAQQHLGHLALDDAPREPLGDGGLADAGLADEQRVVLAAAAEDLDGPLDLHLATDQRVDLAGLGLLVEVGGVLLERASALAVARLRGGRGGLLLLGLLLAAREPVRDEVDDIEARHALLAEQEHGMALLLAEDGDQHVGDADLLAPARLHMEQRALQHPLEAERRLHLAFVALAQPRRAGVDVRRELAREALGFGAAGAQDLAHLRALGDGEQQVLDRQELVPPGPRLVVRLVDAGLELVGKHAAVLVLGSRAQVSSSVHISGCWWLREWSMTIATLVSAIW